MSTLPPALLHSYAKPAAPADAYLNIVSASGATVTDADGREYVDALASLWYCQVGHGRAEIVEAITAQLGKLDTFHTFDRFTNPAADALAEALVDIAPMPGARAFLTSGGSEAVESALKLARVAHHQAGESQRTVLISRVPSYHGVTYGSMAVTGLPLNREGFGPLVGDVMLVPYDDLDALDKAIAEVGAERVAAIIAEPVVGAGGVLPPPEGYLQGLRARCDSVGAFLILDEVICGFGRLGSWFGATRYGVEPDLVTFAKGVSSGYLPVGGVLVGAKVRARLEADPAFILRHGHTYSGHPTACAAALANLGVLRDEGLVERAPAIGQRLSAGLREVAESSGGRITEVRGEGAVWAVVLAAGDSSGGAGGAGAGGLDAAGAPGAGGLDAVEVRDRMLGAGVIARPLGPSVVAFCPPLMISDDQLDRCAEALSEAIRV